MFAQSIPWHACVAVALGCALLSTPARSQDRPTMERLDRIERDLNMMQRQVYRGGPSSAMAGDPGLAVSAEIRMERLESQMRDLTGRVEEFTNRIEQLRQRVEQINSDTELRLNPGAPGAVASAAPALPPRSLPPGGPPGGPPGAPLGARRGLPDPMGSGGSTPALPGRPMAPGTAVPGPNAAPVYGTLTPPGTMPGTAPGAVPATLPPSASELASTGTGRNPGGLPGGSATEQYNYAFGLLKQANYAGAEEALRAFLQRHPNDPMAGNAHYWLGETFYARAKYIEAATAFAEGYKRYPKGGKAPDELLKLGMALGHANQKQNACVALAQLDRDFPHPTAAIKERAKAEKKRLGC